MERKKELKEQYKNFKPDMGIIGVKCSENNKIYLVKAKDINGMINRIKFQLGFGSYTNNELQKDYNTFGEKKFSFEVIEKLEYDKDEAKTDYSEDLDTLLELCRERMTDITFYK